jgi:murein L,D-transpeptidase YafK
MRRFLVISAIILCLAIAGFAYIRNTPWMYSHFNKLSGTAHEPGVQPDSVRSRKYYHASLHNSIDSIVVIKHIREMYVYHKGELQKIYRVALGDAPVGHKHFEGDEKTPEGCYRIFDKNPNSSCHKNLGISYPNAADRAYAAKHGKGTGGDIKIHGIVNGQGYVGKAHLLRDWTNGCVAITDEEIDELYAFTPTGIPIFIQP